jgi:hypothetical protein
LEELIGSCTSGEGSWVSGEAGKLYRSRVGRQRLIGPLQNFQRSNVSNTYFNNPVYPSSKVGIFPILRKRI